jgi:hypothetical protein
VGFRVKVKHRGKTVAVYTADPAKSEAMSEAVMKDEYHFSMRVASFTNKLLEFTNVDEAFLGSSRHPHSILLRVGHTCFVYIGTVVFEFFLPAEETFVAFESIEFGTVSEGVLFGSKNTYVLNATGPKVMSNSKLGIVVNPASVASLSFKDIVPLIDEKG